MEITERIKMSEDDFTEKFRIRSNLDEDINKIQILIAHAETEQSSQHKIVENTKFALQEKLKEAKEKQDFLDNQIEINSWKLSELKLIQLSLTNDKGHLCFISAILILIFTAFS
jgi:hypothetical protein